MGPSVVAPLFVGLVVGCISYELAFKLGERAGRRSRDKELEFYRFDSSKWIEAVGVLLPLVVKVDPIGGVMLRDKFEKLKSMRTELLKEFS